MSPAVEFKITVWPILFRDVFEILCRTGFTQDICSTPEDPEAQHDLSLVPLLFCVSIVQERP